jgi:hypothetical protein
MNKKLIRLTESDLHKIVKDSVQKILKEGKFDDIYKNYPGSQEDNRIFDLWQERERIQREYEDILKGIDDQIAAHSRWAEDNFGDYATSNGITLDNLNNNWSKYMDSKHPGHGGEDVRVGMLGKKYHD